MPVSLWLCALHRRDSKRVMTSSFFSLRSLRDRVAPYILDRWCREYAQPPATYLDPSGIECRTPCYGAVETGAAWIDDTPAGGHRGWEDSFRIGLGFV